jgi:hypothetical protein
MKYLHRILILPIIGLALSSCEKDEEVIEVASVNVINAAVNSVVVKVNYLGTPVIWSSYTGTAGTVSFSANKMYTLPAGSNVPLTIVPTNDTLTPIYNSNLSLNAYDLYSLYLAGQAPTYETVLIKENIPQRYQDSIIGFRFINLSPNSPAVSVSLSTTPTVTEFADVSYKQSTEFKTYPAKKVTTSYVFQVKNAATGALITTYTHSLTATPGRFWNVTLVLKGLVGTTTGTNAIGIQRVNNY